MDAIKFAVSLFSQYSLYETRQFIVFSTSILLFVYRTTENFSIWVFNMTLVQPLYLCLVGVSRWVFFFFFNLTADDIRIMQFNRIVCARWSLLWLIIESAWMFRSKEKKNRVVWHGLQCTYLSILPIAKLICKCNKSKAIATNVKHWAIFDTNLNCSQGTSNSSWFD